ncbi:uncharacterized protein LOC107269586 [Cephus cinctus]|uniref:Uncharacterized protein LOC107269586 n=1 Tax=Cephus cinctus TaxID=211228 RepID=A0AAJ7FMI9_CEPCN|nr:uncharacterized protein LOC107269586 [Cephus cinctus]
MAQGKLKVKAKPPPSGKNKANKSKKGAAVQRRGNAPIQSKKTKFQEAHKLKKAITKTVNKTMEDELRKRALGGKQSLTKKESATTSKKK